jgi:hypothetical protein
MPSVPPPIIIIIQHITIARAGLIEQAIKPCDRFVAWSICLWDHFIGKISIAAIGCDGLKVEHDKHSLRVVKG